MRQVLQFNIPVTITIDSGTPSEGPGPGPGPQPEPSNELAETIKAAYLAEPPNGLGRLPDANELASEIENAGKYGIETMLHNLRERAAS